MMLQNLLKDTLQLSLMISIIVDLYLLSSQVAITELPFIDYSHLVTALFE